jgi:hypothetical protein
MANDERRQHVRLESSLPVMYWLSPDDRAPQPSVTKNVSGGGVCLYVNEPLPLGTTLQVQRRLPEHDRTCSFTAEVAWCGASPAAPIGRGPVMTGPRFLEIAADNRQQIIHHCMRQVPSSGKV